MMKIIKREVCESGIRLFAYEYEEEDHRFVWFKKYRKDLSDDDVLYIIQILEGIKFLYAAHLNTE